MNDAAADRRRKRGGALDLLARHCAALGGLSLGSFAIAVNCFFMLLNLAFACYEPDAPCHTAESRLTVVLIVSASASVIAAVLALAGLVRAWIRGWPDGGSHRVRAAVAVACIAPTALVVLALGVAWFVDWYRT